MGDAELRVLLRARKRKHGLLHSLITLLCIVADADLSSYLATYLKVQSSVSIRGVVPNQVCDGKVQRTSLHRTIIAEPPLPCILKHKVPHEHKRSGRLVLRNRMPGSQDVVVRETALRWPVSDVEQSSCGHSWL